MLIVGLVILTIAFTTVNCVAASIAAQQQAYRKNNGLLLIPNVFPKSTFAQILAECKEMRTKNMKMEVGSLAVGRMGCHVSTETISHKCLFSQQLCQRISRIALPRRSFRRTEETRGADDDNDGAQLHSVFSCDAQLELQNRHGRVLEPALDIPLELRLYPVGSSMPFHCDDCLYAIPQLEFIYTVENDSDSKTVWVDAEGITRAGAPDGAALTTTSTTTSSSITSTVHLTISTNDDTLATSVPVAGVATEPFGCMHCVTPVNRGSRLILKGVWTLTQERIDDVHLDNSGSKRISKGKRKVKFII